MSLTSGSSGTESGLSKVRILTQTICSRNRLLCNDVPQTYHLTPAHVHPMVFGAQGLGRHSAGSSQVKVTVRTRAAVSSGAPLGRDVFPNSLRLLTNFSSFNLATGSQAETACSFWRLPGGWGAVGWGGSSPRGLSQDVLALPRTARKRRACGLLSRDHVCCVACIPAPWRVPSNAGKSWSRTHSGGVDPTGA